MKILKLLNVGILCSLLFASPAALAVYTCEGPVTGVAIDVGGDVLLQSLGPVLWPRLCNVRATANNVAPEACKTIYASLLAAQASGRTVTIWIGGPAAPCVNLPQWQFVSGFYFLRVDG